MNGTFFNFYRGTAVTAEGRGLGLTLVHRIAGLHDARNELRGWRTRGTTILERLKAPRMRMI